MQFSFEITLYIHKQHSFRHWYFPTTFWMILRIYKYISFYLYLSVWVLRSSILFLNCDFFSLFKLWIWILKFNSWFLNIHAHDILITLWEFHWTEENWIPINKTIVSNIYPNTLSFIHSLKMQTLWFNLRGRFNSLMPTSLCTQNRNFLLSFMILFSRPLWFIFIFALKTFWIFQSQFSPCGFCFYILYCIVMLR